MRALVLCSGHNSGDRHDATGAFIPKAREFARIHSLTSPTMFDHRQSDRARERSTEEAIRGAPRPLDCFAYFGHGVSRGLSSLGFTGHNDTVQLAHALGPVAANHMVVLLYACSAANEFAPELARLLNLKRQRVRVFGHTTAAHTTRNPFMKEFPADRWVVEPHSAQWQAWRRALRSTRLWAEFPWLSQGQLHEALSLPTSQVDQFLTANITRKAAAC